MEVALIIAIIVMFFVNAATIFFSKFISHAANSVFAFLVGLQFIFYPNKEFGLAAGIIALIFSFASILLAYRAKKEAHDEKGQES